MLARPALCLLLLAPALAAQTATQTTPQTTPSRIGGAQANNTRVNDSSTTTTTTTDASGAAHVVLKPHATTRAATKAASKPAPSHLLPMNDTIPTDPMVAVQLWPEAFKPLVLHREPCVITDPRDTALHTRGPVVIDVELDKNGVVDTLDYIGPPDLGAACMEAVKSWKFAPYQFHGQPWRVGSWVRFEFPSPYQHSALAVLPLP